MKARGKCLQERPKKKKVLMSDRKTDSCRARRGTLRGKRGSEKGENVCQGKNRQEWLVVDGNGAGKSGNVDGC